MEQSQNGIWSFVQGVQAAVQNFFIQNNITTVDVLRYLASFGIGFVVGIFAKHSLKYIIFCTLFALLLLTSLGYFEFIFFNTVKIKTVLGLEGIDTLEAFIELLSLQVQLYWVSMTAVLVGASVGYFVG